MHRFYNFILLIGLLLFSYTNEARSQGVNSSKKVTGISPAELRCEYLSNPEGIDIPDPRFYWKLVSDENGQYQTAYKVLVATSAENLNKNIGDAFDSKKTKSGQNTHVVYKGAKLKPASEYFWKVRVWDKNNKPSEWSETATFSTGLFTDSDWKSAQWIAWKPQQEWETEWWQKKDIELKCTELYLPSYFGARMSMWERYYFHKDKPYDPAPLYRKEFSPKKQVRSAKAFISGIGYYELFINGKRVGDHVLDPGWTNYTKTILYVSHDISNLVKQGQNAIGVMLGRGNYGLIALDHWGFYQKSGYIGQPKLKCRFVLEYTDGTEENIVSDLSWKVTGGPILYDCPHMGELYDANKEIKGWNEPGLNDIAWDKVQPAPSPGGEMKAQLCQPIRVVKTFNPKVVFPEDFGAQRIDAGTNMAGWIRVKVDAPKGAQIIVYYGENKNPLDHDQPGGYQQMAYIAKGVPGEIAECHFSYKGFRYATIKGHVKTLSPEDIEICQVNTDVPLVGGFTSSDSTLNAIHRICTKAMISNVHSIPTDCPHREKNGWMGDAVTGMEMGMENYDMAALITKYMRDVFDTQDSEGRLSTIAPDNDYTKGLSPLWSSACVHLPWYMYNYYGDTRLFEQYWDRMKLYTGGVWKHKQVEGKPGIFTDVLADWCSPHGNISEEGPEVYTTMNFFLVLKRLSYMANILGKKNDAAEFEKQSEQVRNAIYKYCFDEKNIVFGGVNLSDYRQGPNAMALQYEIVKPEHRNQVLEKLLNDISVNRHNHFYGGIFTGHTLWELMPKTGNAELAYKVAVNDTHPGYGYMLKNGATTVWEHWDDKASHIHYFMGFVDNFLIRHIAGINTDINNSGFKTVRIEPKFIESLSNSSANYNSIHGPISVKWEKNNPSTYYIHISIPANCDAEFVLPEKSIEANVDGKLTKFLKDEKTSKNLIRLKSGSHQINLKTKNL